MWGILMMMVKGALPTTISLAFYQGKPITKSPPLSDIISGRYHDTPGIEAITTLPRDNVLYLC